MSLAYRVLSSAFPEMKVRVTSRPDGGQLITLEDLSGMEINRAISYAQSESKTQLEWLVSAIKRDLALSAGQTPNVGRLQSQSRYELPRYFS